MLCPKCNNALIQKMYFQVPIMVCTQCGGIWFEQGELKEYIDDLLIERQDIQESPVTLEKKSVIGQIKIQEPLKPCPKCRQSMTPYNYCYDSNIILDKCTPCQGIWVDGGKIEQIAQYHKVNPHLDGIGAGLAQGAGYRAYLEAIKNNWKDGYKR